MSLSIKHRQKTQNLETRCGKTENYPGISPPWVKTWACPVPKGSDGVFGNIPGLAANIQSPKISVETSGSLMISNTILRLA
jgi:hypothetical protein